MCGKAGAVGVSSIAAFAWCGSGIIFVLPMAFVSWILIERPSLRLRPHVASLLKTRNGTVQLAG